MGKGFTTDFTDGTDKIPLDTALRQSVAQRNEILAQSSAEGAEGKNIQEDCKDRTDLRFLRFLL
jgi:hypothetical protein